MGRHVDREEETKGSTSRSIRIAVRRQKVEGRQYSQERCHMVMNARSQNACVRFQHGRHVASSMVHQRGAKSVCRTEDSKHDEEERRPADTGTSTSSRDTLFGSRLVEQRFAFPWSEVKTCFGSDSSDSRKHRFGLVYATPQRFWIINCYQVITR